MSRRSLAASTSLLRRPLPALLALMAVCAPARAQISPIQSIGGRPAPPRISIDEPGDGRIWVRGATYKASFGVEGVTYIPFFGSHAPRNHPIELTIWSVTAGDEPIPFDRRAVPWVDGDSVLFHRGTFIERWNLRPDGVEQTFVFDNSSRRGELAVELVAFTDLEMSEDDDVIRFENELGHVEYSRAVALDMEGRSCAVATVTEGARIRLAVPAAFVESANTPITIDPVLTVFPIHTLPEEQWLPDVAHDASTDRWIAVYEERFSATDIDVFARLLSSGGADLGGQYVDLTSTVWAVPHVANNNVANQFLAVATVGDPFGGARTVRGRTIAAANGAMGAQFTINGLSSGDLMGATVGGDPAPSGTTFYCVAWRRRVGGGGGDLHYRLVRADGTFLQIAPAVLDNSGADDGEPSLSRSCGNPPTATQNWNVAWRRNMSLGVGHVYGGQIHRDGTLTAPPFGIQTSTSDPLAVSVSSPQDEGAGGRHSLVAWYREQSGHTDVVARILIGAAVDTQFYNLSSKEADAGSGALARDQYSPQVECDGTHFVVAYTEIDEQADHEIYAATFTLFGSSTLRVTEAHQPLGQTASNEDYACIAARRQSGSAGSARFMAAWSRTTASGKDVHGGLYDAPAFHSFCIPGDDAADCPCSNPPIGRRGCNNSANTGGALLVGAGTPSLTSDTVTLTTTGELPNAPSLLVQGNAFTSAVFGQGRRCTGGTLKRMYTRTASGGSISVPAPGDPSVSLRSAIAGDPLTAGATRSYFVYYRAPIVIGGCAPTATFNTSQAVYVTWWP